MTSFSPLTRISKYSFIDDAKDKISLFLQIWKNYYSSIVMERVSYKNDDNEKHYFAYFYSKTDNKDEVLRELPSTSMLNFEKQHIEVDDFVKFLKSNYQKWCDVTEDFSIEFPDGVEYIIPRPEGRENTLPYNTFYLKEELILSQNRERTGAIYPCYRIYIEPTQFDYKEYPFSIISEIGYPAISLAVKNIFNHQNEIFSRYGFSDISFPLIIDLSHFQYRIKNLLINQRDVNISIEKMAKEITTNVRGILSLKYPHEEYRRYEVRFQKGLYYSNKFENVILDSKLYLLSDEEIGFGGRLFGRIKAGRVLDYINKANPRIGHSDVSYIDIERYSEEEILRLINVGEEELIELKSTKNISDEKKFYSQVGKQMAGMANLNAEGLVIFGVNKKRDIEGVGLLDVTDIQDSLLQTLDERCDPWLSFLTKEFSLKKGVDSKKIFVVSIIASKKLRPYLYKDLDKSYKLPLRRLSYTNWLNQRDTREFYQMIHKENNS